jgi:hypothetical protein
MLIEGECEGLGPLQAAAKFGFSKQRYFQYRWRPARGPFSRRERAGSKVARWGARWNVG